MKIQEIRQRLSEVQGGLIHLGELDQMDNDEARTFDWLAAEDLYLREQLDDAERRSQAVARARDGVPGTSEAGFTAPNVNVRTSDDPYDVTSLRFDTPASELRSQATNAVEQTVGDLDDSHRARAIELIRRTDDPQGTLAKRILATGTPAYRSAFQKVAGGHAHMLDSNERQALARAQSLTNSEGGFAIPFTLDPTIIMTNDGAANPFRQVSRVETIVTDSWNGVSSAGVTGGYAAESSEVGDDAATLAQPSIDVERWDVFVPFSFEIGQDWANLEGDVRMMVNERRDEFDVVAFTSGSGTDEPTGIITALDGSGAEVSPATGETFAVADVYAVEAGLAPRYRRTSQQASWMYALPTMHTIRQFASDDGHALLERIGAGSPSELLGYRAYENSALGSTSDIDAAATEDNHILVLGDWRNYIIVDRAGLNMELVPHLFATANNRPSGQRGFLAWGRTGAGCVNTNAFSVLNVATTA